MRVVRAARAVAAEGGSEMDSEAFWAIIEQARAESKDECEGVALAVQRHLEAIPLQDIEEFCHLFDSVRDSLDTWDLRGVAALLDLGQDDGFDYFRGWIIAQGRETVLLAQNDPETLGLGVDPVRSLPWCEDMISAGRLAYKVVTGKHGPRSRISNGLAVLPHGKKLSDLEDIRERFPRLFAKAEAEGWGNPPK